MSLIRELIEVSIKNRDSNNLNQTLQIVFPNQMEDKELIIHEYDGSIPRLFGDDNHIELMLPEYMDTIVENAVVDAIENGTLFDDAEKVNNTAAYITMAHYPLNGMANKGLNEPHAIKHAIGSVVGAMNSEGRFGDDEVDIDNGINFAHDIVDHGNRDNVNELVGSYLDAKEANNLPVAFKKSTRKIADEVEDIKKVKPEDSITASDIDDGFSNGKTTADEVDDVETKKECGCVSGCGECGDTPGWTEEEDDIPESNVDNGGDTETIDEEDSIFPDLGKMTKEKLAEIKKQDDAKYDEIKQNNAKHQEEMQRQMAEMRARVMARRNGSVNEEAEAAPGESWNKTTAGNINEYAIYREFGINIDELNNLYQELDNVYASLDPYERNYYMETGEVSDKTKQSKIENTWEKIKQWFRRTFLVIVANFEKLEINHRIDEIYKALNDGKRIAVLQNMPHTPLNKDEFEEMKTAWKFLGGNESRTDANKLKQYTAVLKTCCEKYKAVVESEKKVLDEAKSRPSAYTLYTKDSEKAIRLLIDAYKTNIQYNSSLISIAIKEFKKWNRENRKNESFDEQGWRVYFDYFIKTVAYMISEAKFYLRSIRIWTEKDVEELKKAGKLQEYYVDTTSDDYVSEGFFNRPKKLKPIPRNVVAYITVEINAIQDTNDQQMLASYTCAKLELVDFYITCIDTKDERYIVPHTREYLVQMQNDLNRLLTRILQIRPVNRNDNRWKAILPEGRF